MRELTYGRYIIDPSPARTRGLYKKRGPHLYRCSCPGCQNFFKSIVPYRDELAAAVSPLGISWDKPDKITVEGAADGEVFYAVSYSFYGFCKGLPSRWTTEKNELGTINLHVEGGLYRLNERLNFAFIPIGKEKLRLEVTAELPWLMETLNCIYDPAVTDPEKRQSFRAKRIYLAARHIIDSIKEEV